MGLNHIICLMGPTASGKTKLAIELAQNFPCEIISVDSGMIYRGMDIGTAKPTSEELTITPHHLINILDPSDSYSVAQFRVDALQIINEILGRGKIPLLVGGTMLYFKVLQNGISKLPSANLDVRAKLEKEIEDFGLRALYERLLVIDPITAQRIDLNDTQRIQRALEVYELSGKTMSEWFSENVVQPLQYKILNLIIAPAQRYILREKIAKRLEMMFRCGFISEVEKLYTRGDLHKDLPSMRAVGYRQIWRYLAGELTYDAMYELIGIATNQLAKRQLTWLRSWSDAEWFDSEGEELPEKILRLINR